MTNSAIKFKSSKQKTLDDDNRLDDNKILCEEFISTLLHMENIIVLAGSGTSLSLNFDPDCDPDCKIAPSMQGLWVACKTNSEDIFQETLNITKYPVHPDSTNPKGEESNNIELLLSLVDGYIDFGEEGENKNKLTEFKKIAIKKIFDATNFVETREVELKNRWATHNAFINKLGQRKIKQSRLKIFTTNYDMVFEKAASNEGFVIIDGFDFSKPHRFNPMWYEYDIVRRADHHEQNGSYLENVIQLYKLHGSVDWRRKNNEVQKASGSDNDTGDKVIIYPSSSKYKSSYDSPYLDMISSFTQALKQPNTALICVGFGFNDDHLNNAINMALRTNTGLYVLIATLGLFETVEKGNLLKVQNNLSPSIKTFDTLIEQDNCKRVALLDTNFKDFVALIPANEFKNPDTELSIAQLKTLLGEKSE